MHVCKCKLRSCVLFTYNVPAVVSSWILKRLNWWVYGITCTVQCSHFETFRWRNLSQIYSVFTLPKKQTIHMIQATERLSENKDKTFLFCFNTPYSRTNHWFLYIEFKMKFWGKCNLENFILFFFRWLQQFLVGLFFSQTTVMISASVFQWSNQTLVRLQDTLNHH